MGSQQMANAQVKENNVRVTRRRLISLEGRLNKLVYFIRRKKKIEICFFLQKLTR